jgi:para-aminobenzoate synthetase component 2
VTPESRRGVTAKVHFQAPADQADARAPADQADRADARPIRPIGALRGHRLSRGQISGCPQRPPGTVAVMDAATILVIDNYDSFVYNLVQYLGELGVNPVVRRNDALSAEEAWALQPAGVLLSPGPGRPEDAGVTTRLLADHDGTTPVLGVCLGHQAIAAAYGASVVRAPQLMHGKTSELHHDGSGVFVGLPDPLVATRYHSLVVDPASVPPALQVTATTIDGVIMGIRHRQLPIEGVQFHPESILTGSGHQLLANWLVTCGVEPLTETTLRLPPSPVREG